MRVRAALFLNATERRNRLPVRDEPLPEPLHQTHAQILAAESD